MKHKSITLFFSEKLTLCVIFLSFLSSCVPQRKYVDLETKMNDAETARKECLEELQAAHEHDSICTANLSYQMHAIRRMSLDSIETNTMLTRTKRLYNDLSDTYERLLKYNQTENQKFSENMKDLESKTVWSQKELETRQAEIERKNQELKNLQQDLVSREAKMKEMQQGLDAREAKVAELRSLINAKDSTANALKNSLTASLLSYKDAGLEVNMKNGKVYVSMSEQLLFASGSIAIDKKGKEALLKLAQAVSGNDDLNILVEGHTDDVPIHTEKIADNWDLSVLRANSIVRILTHGGGLSPKQVTSSGRGEFLPLDNAKSAEARRKNRRSEIILTPNLDKMFQILETR